MSKFEVGSRVVDTTRSNLKTHDEYEDGGDVTRGAVVSLIDAASDKVKVKWDSQWIEPRTSTIAIKNLMSEKKANQILSKLEAEYESWAGPIREKLKAAGELLREAAQLAQAKKRDLTEMHDLVGELTEAMDDIGWRTSSLSC